MRKIFKDKDGVIIVRWRWDTGNLGEECGKGKVVAGKEGVSTEA